MAPKRKQKERDFQVGDLVAAKIRGHRIWPSRVESIQQLKNHKRYTVRFFGTGEISSQLIQIKSFEEMTQKELEPGKKDFNDAILECRKHLEGRTSRIDNETKDNGETEEKSLSEPAKSNHSLSKSTIDHNSRLSVEKDENVMQNPTIEKLKKKIEIKMQEKEALKINRLQKKAYERASKKFPTVYKKLDQVLSISEKLLNENKGNKNATAKLEDAHTNLEATLLKCIDKLTTDYGKRQSDCIRFQDKLTRIIKNLKQVREIQSTKNPNLAKVAKRVLKVYKTKVIREFINDSEIADNLHDSMNDRKENDAIKME